VCLLVTTTSCAKTDEPIEMPFGVWTQVGPRNSVLGRARIPLGKEQFFFGGGHLPAHCEVYNTESKVVCLMATAMRPFAFSTAAARLTFHSISSVVAQ